MKPTERFEQFLLEQHAKDYRGCDDDMPDDFNKWLCNLEVDDWLAYGDKFNQAVAEALPEIVNEIQYTKSHMTLLLESLKWLEDNHNRLPIGHTITQWIKNQRDVVEARLNKTEQALNKMKEK